MSYRKSSSSLFFLLLVLISLGLISGGILVYQHRSELRERSQELKALEEQTRQKYDLQQKHLVSTNDLINSPKIHSFFTNLLRNYAEKFAKSKELNISRLPLKFAGFYVDERKRSMGKCWIEQGISKIILNRLYLLNKFGHDDLLVSVSDPQLIGGCVYAYDLISFAKIMGTCAHELAHYFQFIKHNKSSCQSDLIKKTGKYNKELAQEHEKWTKEIYEMIKNLGYLELEKEWKRV